MKRFLSIMLVALLASHAHADTKISQFPSGGTIQSTDTIPVVRGGANYGVTAGTAATHAASDFLSPSSIVTATGATIGRSIPDQFGNTYDAANFGVTCDGTQLSDINITNGAATVSSQSYTFTAGNVGANVVLTDTNQTTILNTTIQSVAGGNATLAANWTGSTINTNTGRMTFYVTDNTQNINNAISQIVALSADSGGRNTRGFKLNFPRGICVTGAITQPRLSMLACKDGSNACALFLKTGTNAPLIASENFAALTGTGLNYGPNGTYNGRASDVRVPSWYGLQDIRLDCNKLGQTGGRCVQYYGNMELMLGTVQVEDAYSDCIYSEASDAPAWSLTDWKSFEEGIYDHVRTRNCGGYGWLDRGPHDKVVSDFVDAESNLTGYRSELSGGLYSGTGHLVKMHAYAEANHTAFYIGTPSSIDEIYPDYGNMEIASVGVSIGRAFYTAAGYGNLTALLQDAAAYRLNIAQANIDVYPSATGISIIDLKGGTATLSNLNTTGISAGSNITLLKVESSFNNLSGVLENAAATGDICLSMGGSNNIMNFTGFSCTTFIDPTPDGGQNQLNFNIFKASGTNYTSGYAFQASDFINVSKDDGTYIRQAPHFRSSSGSLEYTGPAPAVASGASDCGTSPSVSGNNGVGRITVGSSTNGGKCTITFANSFSYAHPNCSCYDYTQGTVLRPTTASTTLACAGTLTAGDRIDYSCAGYYP